METMVFVVTALLLPALACHRLSVPLDDLLSAPGQVRISERDYRLEAYVVLPSNPEPAQFDYSVDALDSLPFGAGITVDRFWLISPEFYVWEDVPDSTTSGSMPWQLTGCCGGGPVWNWGGYVISEDFQLVVRLRGDFGTALLRDAQACIIFQFQAGKPETP